MRLEDIIIDMRFDADKNLDCSLLDYDIVQSYV
jgi:hypothetical protein